MERLSVSVRRDSKELDRCVEMLMNASSFQHPVISTPSVTILRARSIAAAPMASSVMGNHVNAMMQKTRAVILWTTAMIMPSVCLMMIDVTTSVVAILATLVMAISAQDELSHLHRTATMSPDFVTPTLSAIMMNRHSATLVNVTAATKEPGDHAVVLIAGVILGSAMLMLDVNDVGQSSRVSADLVFKAMDMKDAKEQFRVQVT
jgi:hypothetical protein